MIWQFSADPSVHILCTDKTQKAVVRSRQLQSKRVEPEASVTQIAFRWSKNLQAGQEDRRHINMYRENKPAVEKKNRVAFAESNLTDTISAPYHFLLFTTL